MFSSLATMLVYTHLANYIAIRIVLSSTTLSTTEYYSITETLMQLAIYVTTVSYSQLVTTYAYIIIICRAESMLCSKNCLWWHCSNLMHLLCSILQLRTCLPDSTINYYARVIIHNLINICTLKAHLFVNLQLATLTYGVKAFNKVISQLYLFLRLLIILFSRLAIAGQLLAVFNYLYRCSQLYCILRIGGSKRQSVLCFP